MKIVKVKDYEELSQKAAAYFIQKIKQTPTLTLGLATGSTPEGMYRYLVKDHEKNKTSYRKVKTFNLDEYYGLNGTDKNSYRYFMNQHLLHHIDIELTNAHVPYGDVQKSDVECATYEQLIKQHGGIDLQLLGIGANGHIGFNEPGSSFESRTRVVKLTEKTRQDNARFFNGIDEVPTHALTMGLGTIMESKEIVLIASGAGKKDTMRILLSGKISPDFPASVLHGHPNITVMADEEALAGIQI